MVSKPASERRRDPRLDNNVPVKICQDGGDIVTETRNISRSGAYCQVNRYIEPMTKMKVYLLLSTRKNGEMTSKKVSCEGIIVRAEPALKKDQYNVAIFFNDISQRSAETLSDYVSSHLEQVS